MRIPDNLEQFENHDAEQGRQLQKLPKCIECGEPIQQEDALKTQCGFICDFCLEGLREEIIMD